VLLDVGSAAEDELEEETTVTIPEAEEAPLLETAEDPAVDPDEEPDEEPPEGETEAPERRPVPQPTGLPFTMTVSVGSVWEAVGQLTTFGRKSSADIDSRFHLMLMRS
jgi:hypothetical protein